jgi:hypothetical protein
MLLTCSSSCCVCIGWETLPPVRHHSASWTSKILLFPLCTCTCVVAAKRTSSVSSTCQFSIAPRFVRTLPLISQPSYSQGLPKVLQVNDTYSSTTLWATDTGPINFAFTPMELLASIAQRKRRLNLSISLYNFFGGLRDVSKSVGRDPRTVFTSSLRPPILSSCPCHPANLVDARSKRGCRANPHTDALSQSRPQ